MYRTGRSWNTVTEMDSRLMHRTERTSYTVTEVGDSRVTRRSFESREMGDSRDCCDENDSRRRRRGYLGEAVEGRTNVMADKEFRERMKLLFEEIRGRRESQLKPVKVDFQVEKNRKEHHTDDYETDDLVIRRGQVFNVSVTFDRRFDAEKDKVILQFVTGPRPQQSKNTIIRVQSDTRSLSTSSWGMKIANQSGATLTLSVMSPADAIVGEYSVYVETKSKTPGGENFRKKQDEKVIILFNAWCKDDSVYMSDEDHRREYVLNDHGRIWVGSYKNFAGIPWNFGQFEQVSLETCLKLFDLAELGPPARANPIRVSRCISQMANFNDRDGGILYGRWDGNYSDGSSPSAWTGSVAILEKFAAQKYNTVRYGQCWVFSGLVTTLLRAIGIPTRSVTNFASAHDTDQSTTIDFHFDEEGKPLDRLNDSVWNFHVWNESYFTRPDLPDGYDGWQVHDATPQEHSDGVFRCGPCPVKAVKNGEVYLPYDTGFVFAEVNGDEVKWEVDADGEMTVLSIKKSKIGKFISTKAVGDNNKNRADLTHYYKFSEGSSQEREAVRRAYKYSSRKDEEIFSKPTTSDVSFEVRTSDDVMIGDDMKVELFMKNNSEARRTVKVAIVTKLSFYTGITAKELDSVIQEVTLAGLKEKSVILPVTADNYIKLVPDASIKAFFKAKVLETGQNFSDMDIVEFKKPDLEANIPDKLQRNKPFEVSFHFTNPLPVKLTNAVLNVECSRMTPRYIIKKIEKDIEPHDEVNISVSLESKRSGKRYIEASFQSDQLSGVRGEFEVDIV